MGKQEKILVRLLERSGPKLHTLLLRLTLNEHTAEDLMQELFCRLCNVKDLSQIKNLEAYARQVALHLGYDWLLKDIIWSYPSIWNLNDRLYNEGYRPGANSFFLRFLENQDEDRVAYRYNSIEKTIPVSTAIFMATGIPLIFQGQEVGMGFGMGGDKDYRLRTTVNWKTRLVLY